jgi:peptidoglycan/xylan/chitin deacetylase (PgdA/CDA1 family)
MKLNIFKLDTAILNYHRICPDTDLVKPNSELIVSVSKFKEQLIFLKKNYDLVSLDEFLKFNKSNKFKISVTFDDGYKDNLTYALPILNELNIPATIYVVTKFFDNDFNIWWRELEDYIWSKNENIKFSFDQIDYYFSTNSNEEKTKCFENLKKIIKKVNKKKQDQILSAVTKTDIRKQYNDEFLSIKDLQLLKSNPLITIGAHTHNHLSLKNISYDECFNEVKKSKLFLEELLNSKINHFSYPYGSKNDAGSREFKIVEDLGFQSGVTTSVGKINKKKLYSLPRIHMNQKSSEKILKIKLSIFYFIYRKIREIF